MADLPSGALSVRVMRADEWSVARAVCIDAFDDPGIPVLLDLQRSSWSWRDELAFVADLDGEVVAMEQCDDGGTAHPWAEPEPPGPTSGRERASSAAPGREADSWQPPA